jgi:hypothetical protein
MSELESPQSATATEVSATPVPEAPGYVPPPPPPPPKKSRGGLFFFGALTGCLLLVGGAFLLVVFAAVGGSSAELSLKGDKVAVLTIEGTIMESRSSSGSTAPGERSHLLRKSIRRFVIPAAGAGSRSLRRSTALPRRVASTSPRPAIRSLQIPARLPVRSA